MIPSHVSIDLQLLVDFVQVLRFSEETTELLLRCQSGVLLLLLTSFELFYSAVTQLYPGVTLVVCRRVG